MEESRHPESGTIRRPALAKTLGIRIAVGAVLIPVVLALTYTGGWAYAIFVGLLAALGSYELLAMAARADVRPSRTLGIVGSAAVAVSFRWPDHVLPGIVLAVAVLAVLVERLVRSTKERYLWEVSLTCLALLYPGALLGYFVWLRDAPVVAQGVGGGPIGTGTSLVYFVLILTWSYDSFAYLAGSSLGRHKLFPRISPSKTVEGLFGGLAGSVAAALICRATFVTFIGAAEAVLLGVALGIIAQIGDVAESMMKRSTGAKDSSNLIPGHGGFLDRFDSLLFTGPAFYFYARLALC